MAGWIAGFQWRTTQLDKREQRYVREHKCNARVITNNVHVAKARFTVSYAA